MLHEGHLEVAQLKSRHDGYRRRDWYEVKDYQEVVALNDEDLEPEEREARRAMKENVEEIIDTASRLTKEDQSQSGKDKSTVKESRLEMREQLRQDESWQPDEVSEGLPTQDLIGDISSPVSPERIDAILEEDDLSILEKIRRRAWQEGDDE